MISQRWEQPEKHAALLTVKGDDTLQHNSVFDTLDGVLKQLNWMTLSVDLNYIVASHSA